jgi:hypothetical protein
MSSDKLDDNSGDTSWIRGSGRSGDSSWLRRRPSQQGSLSVKNIASSMKKTKALSPNNSYDLAGNKSVSFATGTNMMDSAASFDAVQEGQSRVAAAKAKLRNSFTVSSLASKRGSMPTTDMDQSWGGVLRLGGLG